MTTNSNERQSQQLASTLAWLEDTVRENKGQVARLLQQAEQTQGQVWDLAHRIQRAEEANVALTHELGAAPRLETELRAVSDKLIRLEERVVAAESRVHETGRLHQIEGDHIRSELTELIKRVDGWERPVANWATRMDTLEEIGRRGQEATTVVRQQVEGFEKYMELVDQRVQRLGDVLKRVDGEFALVTAEIEALRKQEEGASDRFQVYAEGLRRLEGRIDEVAEQTDVRREFNEKFELQRTGLRRSEERLNLVEATSDDFRQRMDDLARAIALIDAKGQSVRERLAEVAEELGSYRSHLSEFFHKSASLEERQRRRRIEDLEREIREVKVHAYRPPEE